MSAFERVIAAGGVVLFPSDTVYGLACSPSDRGAVERLYALKGRPPDQAAAVMFFELEPALAAVADGVGERTRAALGRLLPGGVTLLLRNPERRFPLACRADPETLGLRVISAPALAGVRVPVLQSSANLSGGSDARCVADVPASIRKGVDLVVDGGPLPGLASTVVDLRRYEIGGIRAMRVLRQGAVSDREVVAALDGQFHFNPASYGELIRADLPSFDAFQDRAVAAAGERAVGLILELGTGTGETARRLLERFPAACLVGIDERAPMLDVARSVLPAARVDLRVGRLQEPLPSGPFDLVASALCVHHLDGGEKADLFRRLRAVLTPGGRFVLADVIVPADPACARTALTPGYDKPSTVAEQLAWLSEAGFDSRVAWAQHDLAVLVADSLG